MMRAPYWPFPTSFPYTREKKFKVCGAAHPTSSIMIYECTHLYSYAAMMDMSTSMLNFVAKYALTGDQTIPRSLVAREASLRSCTVLGPSFVDGKLSEHIFVSPFRFPDDGGQFFANRKTSSIESYAREYPHVFAFHVSLTRSP